jgi:hypothetical protein
MTAPTITDYLKYANLQMAAEAFIRNEKTGALAPTGDALVRALVAGNNHTSKFTQTEAEAFADPAKGWTVLDQRANTSTGFSGTLFKSNLTGELVISFRSTEFIDDAARDNLATNTDEIKNTGFAWGQISDMEQWYADLQADPNKLGGKAFSVTGYSLGGHLASVFNILHPNAAQQVVTFNGAGVGQVTNGTLAEALATFNTLRQDYTQITARFTNPNLKTLYTTIRTHLNDKSWTMDQAKSMLLSSNEKALLNPEVQSIYSALSEIDELQKEAARVASLHAGGEGANAASKPTPVLDHQILAENLDYRMAVHFAARNTVSAWVLTGLV